MNLERQTLPAATKSADISPDVVSSLAPTARKLVQEVLGAGIEVTDREAVVGLLMYVRAYPEGVSSTKGVDDLGVAR